MRRLPLLIAGGCCAFATPGFAQKSVSVQVNASLARTCSITSAGASVTLNAVDDPRDIPFTYRCNFIGSPTLTFHSTNGGLRGDANGNPLRSYGIYLNDVAPATPPSQWLTSGEAQSDASFGPDGSHSSITTAVMPNQDILPYFRVALTQPLVVAGNYSDTLTVSIAP